MNTKVMKKQNGFVVSDAILAILILIMFTGIITSLIYSIVLTTKRIKLNSEQISYITDVFNYAEQMAYSDVTTENLINYVNGKTENANYITASTTAESLTTPYKMQISVTKYNETEGNFSKSDFIKIITVKVDSTISNKTYSTEMTMLKKIKESELKEIL